jgi:hypothetical protein
MGIMNLVKKGNKMKLIVTLGTTPAKYIHEYIIYEKSYKAKFSFLEKTL